MIQVLINDIDKSDQIEWESLEVEQQLTSQVDTCRFRLKIHAGKTYRPTIGNEVLVVESVSEGALLTEDGDPLITEEGDDLILEEELTTNIFGGTVVDIQDVIEAGLLTHLTISCVSHERTLDRFLAVREFTSKTARYILNALFDEFVNQPEKEIDLGESNESWTTEDGTVAANTTAGQFIEGDQSRKFTATASNTATARRNSALVLTTFSDASISSTADKIRFHAYVDNVANLASIRVRFVTDTLTTYTNYFETTILAAALVDGWNEIIVAKSAFTSVGAPVWSNIQKRQYRVTASAAGTVNVSIDDVRMVDEDCFTMGAVEDADAPIIGSAKFNYEQVSDAIKQIAEVVGCDWYIDPLRVLHFFAPATEAAPFSLTDTSKNFVYNSLEVDENSATIKNQIIVRGGEYQAAQNDFDVVADGTQLNFRSPYRIKNMEVFVDDGGGFDAKTVGVDNLNDPAAFDCLYNFQEKTLKFKTATLPAVGYIVRMRGNPMVPVIVKRGDPTSIATHGIYEFLIIDKSIITQQGARDRASAELRAYRDALIDGQFTTDTPGLHAGQTITITITARGISGDFIIKSVNFRTKSPTLFIYDVKLVSTRAFGVIEYLIGLLRDSKKQIVISDTEVVDVVQDISETITIVDSWAEGTQNSQTETITFGEAEQDQLDHGTIFVLTPYTPASFADPKRPFIFDGSLLA